MTLSGSVAREVNASAALPGLIRKGRSAIGDLYDRAYAYIREHN